MERNDVLLSSPLLAGCIIQGAFSCTRSLLLSKTFIGGAICREFESEALAAKEILDRVVCSREEFSFQMCLESGDDSGTFRNWRQRVPECFDWKLILVTIWQSSSWLTGLWLAIVNGKYCQKPGTSGRQDFLTPPGWSLWRTTYHVTTSVWKMPPSWQWTGHSGGYWLQAELDTEMVQWCSTIEWCCVGRCYYCFSAACK